MYRKNKIVKIDNVKYRIVNFNNMIQVTNENYVEFDLNKKATNKEKFRIELMQNQLRLLINNKKEIYTKSKLLYNLYKNNKLPDNVKERCCNFPLLEEKCIKYSL